MTTGNYEREPKELPEDSFSLDDMSPEMLETLKRTPILLDGALIVTGRPGNYGFVELTSDAEWQETLGGPRFAGPDLLDVLEPREWGVAGEVTIELPEQTLEADPDTEYVVASEVTPGDVVDMLLKTLYPAPDNDNPK